MGYEKIQYELHPGGPGYTVRSWSRNTFHHNYFRDDCTLGQFTYFSPRLQLCLCPAALRTGTFWCPSSIARAPSNSPRGTKSCSAHLPPRLWCAAHRILPFGCPRSHATAHFSSPRGGNLSPQDIHHLVFSMPRTELCLSDVCHPAQRHLRAVLVDTHFSPHDYHPILGMPRTELCPSGGRSQERYSSVRGMPKAGWWTCGARRTSTRAS